MDEKQYVLATNAAYLHLACEALRMALAVDGVLSETDRQTALSIMANAQMTCHRRLDELTRGESTD